MVIIMVVNATFKKYFSYIVAVSLISGGNRSTENHPPVVSYWQTLSHNVVSSTPHVGFELTI